MELKRQPSIASTLETLAHAFETNEKVLKRKGDHIPSAEIKPKRRFSNPNHMTKAAVGLRELAKKIGEIPLKWEGDAPKSAMIVSKARDDALTLITGDIASWLMEKGLVVYLQDTILEQYLTIPTVKSQMATSSNSPFLVWTETNVNELNVDFVITLGGDGTVLYACWLFQEKAPPIIPFNLGSLGFLTVFQLQDFEHILNHILANDDGMRMNLRSRFNCTIHRALGSDNKRAEDHLSTFQVKIGLIIGVE